MVETKEEIKFKPINLQTLGIRINGETPLIMHKWSEKAKKQIRDKQQKKPEAQKAKEARNPEQEFKEAIYTDTDGDYCFPSIAFKKAAVEACRQADITMALARTLFFVEGEFVKIESDEPIMREDTVVIGRGTTDLRYRPEFRNWSCELRIRYNADVISPEQLIGIFELAGFASGIGEDRPNRTGNNFGMFTVEKNGKL